MEIYFYSSITSYYFCKLLEIKKKTGSLNIYNHAE